MDNSVNEFFVFLFGDIINDIIVNDYLNNDDEVFNVQLCKIFGIDNFFFVVFNFLLISFSFNNYFNMFFLFVMFLFNFQFFQLLDLRFNINIFFGCGNDILMIDFFEYLMGLFCISVFYESIDLQ